jgi:hypothetical protein
MVYKGTLNKRDGEVQVYLFDHALLFAKYVKTKNIEQYKVIRRVSFPPSYFMMAIDNRFTAYPTGIAFGHGPAR